MYHHHAPSRGIIYYSVSSAEEAEKLIDDFETRNTVKNFPTTRQAKALEAQVRDWGDHVRVKTDVSLP